MDVAALFWSRWAANLRAHSHNPIGGLVVLLLVTILSIYKPRGQTRYGRRKQQEQRRNQSAEPTALRA